MSVEREPGMRGNQQSHGGKASCLHRKTDILLQAAVSGGKMEKFLIICKFAQRMELCHLSCKNLLLADSMDYPPGLSWQLFIKIVN